MVCILLSYVIGCAITRVRITLVFFCFAATSKVKRWDNAVEAEIIVEAYTRYQQHRKLLQVYPGQYEPTVARTKLSNPRSRGEKFMADRLYRYDDFFIVAAVTANTLEGLIVSVLV